MNNMVAPPVGDVGSRSTQRDVDGGSFAAKTTTHLRHVHHHA